METDTTTASAGEVDTSTGGAVSDAASAAGLASPAAATGGSEAAPFEWNGEFESLTKSEWWAKLPEDMRPVVESGLKSKYGNWQRGYQSKFDEFKKGQQTWTTEREQMRAEMDKVKANRDWFEKLLSADDSTTEMQAKLTEMEKSLNEREAGINDWKGRYEALETEIANREAETEMERLRSQYPDIYEDYSEDANGAPTGAFAEYLKLLEAGYETDRAARMVRAVMPQKAQPPGPRAVELPASVRLSQPAGKAPPASTMKREREFSSFDDAIRQMKSMARSEPDDE
jgi:archaellum component FlaC